MKIEEYKRQREDAISLDDMYGERDVKIEIAKGKREYDSLIEYCQMMYWSRFKRNKALQEVEREENRKADYEQYKDNIKMRRFQRHATCYEEDNKDFQLKRKNENHVFGYLDSGSDIFGIGGNS